MGNATARQTKQRDRAVNTAIHQHAIAMQLSMKNALQDHLDSLFPNGFPEPPALSDAIAEFLARMTIIVLDEDGQITT